MYQHLSVQTKLKSDSLSKNYGFFSLSINQTNRRPSNTIKPTVTILFLYYLLFCAIMIIILRLNTYFQLVASVIQN